MIDIWQKYTNYCITEQKRNTLRCSHKLKWMLLYSLPWCDHYSIVRVMLGKKKRPRGIKYSHSQKQYRYMKGTGISNNLQKLAVNVESCLFIHSVIPTEVKSRRANEPQMGNRWDYFIYIQAVVNKPPTRFWFLFTAGFILFCYQPFTHKHTQECLGKERILEICRQLLQEEGH